MTIDYKKTIEDNRSKFQEPEQLEDFIASYTVGGLEVDIAGLEDDLHEYADGLVPVYNDKIAHEWAEITACQGMTIEQLGEYDSKGGIYKMMMSDLYFYYEGILRGDYEKLLEITAE